MSARTHTHKIKSRNIERMQHNENEENIARNGGDGGWPGKELGFKENEIFMTSQKTRKCIGGINARKRRL